MKNKICLFNYDSKKNTALNINFKKLLASLIVLLIFSFSSNTIHAQSMGISITSITPDASSILELRTTTKGMLIPRMTTTERDAISLPATGLVVYNTTTNLFNFYNGTIWGSLSSGSSAVNSVTGTANRISIGGTSANPTIDIASNYAGQSTITTLGTIGTGTWNGSLINPTYGGTGINNGTKTITLGGNLITSGASALTLTTTGATNVTLPTSGTLTTTSNNLGVFAATTSAELASVLSDETGTGAAVFATSPTLSNALVGTQAIADSSTKAASTAYVDRAITAKAYLSVDAVATLSTSSTLDVVITGMSKTAPVAGSYLVLFNGQCTIPVAYDTIGFSTATAAADLGLIYSDIAAIQATNTTHPLVFGTGEILLAGVYDIAGAASIAGTLTLDGGGNPNALFVIRATGAFNTGAGVNVVLTNGATAKNIFWVADGAIGIGAGTTIDGTLFSHGSAVAVGANCSVNGRLLTTSGAISFGPGTLSLPTGSSLINFRSLSNFVIFTSSGGIANTGASIYTGDIATNAGAITGFATATVNGTIYQAGSTTTITQVNPMATFSLYNNGVLIPNSSRTRTYLLNPSDISLQGIAIVSTGQTIDVRWKIDQKTVNVSNRILTLIKVGN